MKHIYRLLHAQKLVRAGIISAPVSFLHSSLAQLEETCNGCGRVDAKFDYIPDRIIGTYVGYACFIHDWQYYEGKSKEDKKEADKTFKKNLLSLIKLESTSILIVGLRYMVCVLYYLGVKHMGYKSFWRGKDK